MCLSSYSQNREKANDVLVFSKREHNFGKFHLDNGVKSHTFTFKNTGKLPVIIFKAVPSCGCVKAEWTQTPINTGASGNIKVSYLNNMGLRTFSEKIYVYTSLSTSPFTIIVKGDVAPGHSKK